MTPVKLVVFDLDGTLVDAFDDIAAAANHIRQRNGLAPMAVEEVKQFVGHGARRLVAGVLNTDDEAVIETNHDQLVAFYSNHASSSARLYPGAVKLLNGLRSRGIKTAVATNKPHPITQKVVSYLGIEELVDIALGESSEVARKPAPDMFERILDSTGCTASEAVMVGDTEVDIKFARAARARVICVTYGQYPKSYLETFQPDAIVDSLYEVQAVLWS